MSTKKDLKEQLLRSLVSGRISTDELLELRAILEVDAKTRRMDSLASALIIARIDVLLYDHKMLAEALLKIQTMQGLKGEKGDTGATGKQGLRGEGLKGEKGDTGEQGLRGEKGDSASEK
jgi:hypothetical protein